jgi:signal peptidase
MSSVPAVVREAAITVVVVLAVFAVLTAVAGVWPPMVAVESGSMDPNLKKGDLVFVTGVDDPSQVTVSRAADAPRRFGRSGDVVVFDPPNRDGSPIIHRAMFRVEEGENWYDRANESALGDADDCAELTYCPAPNPGYVTKGDDNERYDQAVGRAPLVRTEWVQSEGVVRIPWLGRIRLALAG